MKSDALIIDTKINYIKLSEKKISSKRVKIIDICLEVYSNDF